MAQDSYGKSLRENFRSIRRIKGLTTSDVAKILGVSQAKVSYIENGRGVLSARDVAVLSRQLDVPIIEFYRGLDKTEDRTGKGDLPTQLSHYGAKQLAKSSALPLATTPFEEVFSRALGFVEEERIHQAFCAAFILQAARQEINIDRIFALTGNNPYLVGKIAKEAGICLQILETLNRPKRRLSVRAERQISKILEVANSLVPARPYALSPSELSSLAEYVGESLDAEK